MNVWRLVTHHVDPEYWLRWYRRTGRIAIGWCMVGDIKQQGFVLAKDIADAIKIIWPQSTNAFSGGHCLWNFCYEMKEGDWVILSTGESRAEVMEVEGGYEYKATDGSAPYKHQRQARIVHVDPNVLWNCAGAGPAPGYNIRWALIKCPNSLEIAKARMRL